MFVEIRKSGKYFAGYDYVGEWQVIREVGPDVVFGDQWVEIEFVTVPPISNGCMEKEDLQYYLNQFPAPMGVVTR